MDEQGDTQPGVEALASEDFGIGQLFWEIRDADDDVAETGRIVLWNPATVVLFGNSAADLPHVFECFRRGGNAGPIAGTRIGLAGAKQIVEQHGRAIAAASDESVCGTFTVRFPLADCPTTPLAARA